MSWEATYHVRTLADREKPEWTACTLAVALELAWRHTLVYGAFPSRATLAARTHWSERKVGAALAQLEREGVIRRDGCLPGGGTVRWRFPSVDDAVRHVVPDRQEPTDPSSSGSGPAPHAGPAGPGEEAGPAPRAGRSGTTRQSVRHVVPTIVKKKGEDRTAVSLQRRGGRERSERPNTPTLFDTTPLDAPGRTAVACEPAPAPSRADTREGDIDLPASLNGKGRNGKRRSQPKPLGDTNAIRRVLDAG